MQLLFSTRNDEPMHSATEFFIKRYRDLGLTGGPMDAASIARLEEHLERPIPPAWRAYLAIAGSAPPPMLVGSDCFGDYLFELNGWAVELLKESGDPFSLPDDAIVFAMHQGYQFLYFISDGVTDDPPVYLYFENRPEPERAFARFSDWVAAIV